MALLIFLVAMSVRADDAEAVRTVFARYREAALAHDGATVVGLVTRASLDYYQRMRDLALTAQRDEVEGLPMVDRLLVLRLRHEFTATELGPLSGDELLRLSIEEAWASPKALLPITIATVDVGIDAAVATSTRAGEPTPLRLVFRPVAGVWQLDLIELARGSDLALTQALRSRADRATVDLDTAMRWAIEDTSGHLVDKDLWLPLVTQPN